MKRGRIWERGASDAQKTEGPALYMRGITRHPYLRLEGSNPAPRSDVGLGSLIFCIFSLPNGATATHSIPKTRFRKSNRPHWTPRTQVSQPLPCGTAANERTPMVDILTTVKYDNERRGIAERTPFHSSEGGVVRNRDTFSL